MAEPASGGARRPRLFLLGVGVAGLGMFSCCAAIVYFGDRPTNGIHVEQLEADLSESLPHGSTWEQAEAWFASHGIKPTVLASGPGGAGDAQKVGLSATIPNDSLIESAEIRIFLYFGPDGRLQERIIYRFVHPL